jgi:hypothetical protein
MTDIDEEIRKRYSAEIMNSENITKEYELEMIKHVTNFAVMALKGTFILNGVAAVSTLTLFTNTLINKAIKQNYELLYPATLFAYGTLFSLLACLLAYILQQYFQASCKYDLMTNTQKLEKKFALEMDNYFPKNETKKYINDKQAEIDAFKIEADKKYKIANSIKYFAIIFVALSITFFIFGVNNMRCIFS